MIDGFLIIAAQDLLKILLAQLTIPLQIGDEQINFFFCGLYLFGTSAQFYLCAAGKDFKQWKFLLEDVELAVVYTKKFNRVNGFKVDNCFFLRFQICV